MGKIKFLRSPIGLGFAHRAGETNVSLPESVQKELVEKGYAKVVPEDPPKRTPPKVRTPQVQKQSDTAVTKKDKK